MVTADRAYYDHVRAADAADAASISFPAYVAERRFPLAGTEVRIGRRSSKSAHQPDIDLTGPPVDPGVSRRHAELRRSPDGNWSVIDLHSPNGIQVNGREAPSGTPIPLQPGDSIHLGAWTRITLTCANRAGPTASRVSAILGQPRQDPREQQQGEDHGGPGREPDVPADTALAGCDGRGEGAGVDRDD